MSIKDKKSRRKKARKSTEGLIKLIGRIHGHTLEVLGGLRTCPVLSRPAQDADQFLLYHRQT